MPTEDEKTAEQSAIEKQFEQCCIDYGKAINEGHHQKAESLAMQMMQIAMLRAMNEKPSQEMIWKQMAGECEERGNWAGAEEALKNALAIERDHKTRELAVKTHLDLAGLYELLGRRNEAIAEIDAAVERSRDSEIEAIRAMALEAKTKILLANGDAAAAKETAADALRAIPDEKIHALIKARLLVLLGRSNAVLGDLSEADAILKRALELTSPYGDSNFMGGLQAFFAQVAETNAIILFARGKKADAATAFSQSVARARTIAEQPHLRGPRSNHHLASILKQYAGYLESAERSTDAAAARSESETLLRQLQVPAS
jgi:tetratricopeptide (TPR) repeat protein